MQFGTWIPMFSWIKLPPGPCWGKRCQSHKSKRGKWNTEYGNDQPQSGMGKGNEPQISQWRTQAQNGNIPLANPPRKSNN